MPTEQPSTRVSKANRKILLPLGGWEGRGGGGVGWGGVNEKAFRLFEIRLFRNALFGFRCILT